MAENQIFNESADRIIEQAKEEKRRGRYFESGAYRDFDNNKLDFEGFLSPSVVERYAEYMHSNRKQSDGVIRDSDNWQKGIPLTAYMKSLWRHFFAVWKYHRAMSDLDLNKKDLGNIEEHLCGTIFNAMGMLHEYLKKKGEVENGKEEKL